jgi:hypothetical protein
MCSRAVEADFVPSKTLGIRKPSVKGGRPRGRGKAGFSGKTAASTGRMFQQSKKLIEMPLI